MKKMLRLGSLLLIGFLGLNLAIVSLSRLREPEVWMIYSDFNYADGVELYRIRADGSGRERLTFNRTTERLLIAAPNGLWLAYAQNGVNSHQVFRMDLLTFQEELVTQGTGYIHKLHWSPDSQILFYETNNRGLVQSWSIRATGIQQQLLSHPLPEIPKNDLSPNGRWLAFTEYLTNNEVALYRARADDPDRQAERVTLSTNMASDTFFVWVPVVDLQWSF